MEQRLRLAVRRAIEGWKPMGVAAFLGVTERAVARWMADYRRGGDDALRAKPAPGRPPELSARQGRSVLSWLAESPADFGSKTDLWTTRRLAGVIEKRFGARFHSNGLAAWPADRGYAPKKPEAPAVERDDPVIARRVAEGRPRILRKRMTGGRTSP